MDKRKHDGGKASNAVMWAFVFILGLAITYSLYEFIKYFLPGY